MKFLAVFFFLSCLSLYGDCFDGSIGGGLGYRVDQNCYRIRLIDLPESPTLVKEDWDWVQIFGAEAFTKLRFWWLEFYGQGDYGWVEGGDVKTKLNIIDPEDLEQIPSASFCFDADGDVWDVLGSGGVRFSFCCTNWGEFAIKPLAGYSYHRQSYKRRCVSPFFETVDLVGFDTTFVLLSPSKRLKQHFKGPFAGGDIFIKNKCFLSNFGYTYHWLDFKQEFRLDNTVELFDEDNQFFSRDVISREAKFSTDHGFGHRGWLSFSYLFSNCWMIGAKATYFYVKAKENDKTLTSINTTESLNTLDPPITETLQQMANEKLQWQSFTAMLEAAYSF